MGTTTEARCINCGQELPTGQNPPQPCPACGSERKEVRATISASVGLTQTIRTAASSANNAAVRLHQLEAAVVELEQALGEHNVTETQHATKHALEALHELEDDRRRGEWSHAAWASADVGLWRGLLGARNAAHHLTFPVVTRHSDTPRDESLVWSLDANAIAGLRSTQQRTEYNARVAGQPVLPQLRKAAALVAHEVK